MKITDKFTYRSPYGEYPGCAYAPGFYQNGNPALRICDEEGDQVCVCSVNPPGEEVLGEGEIAVKDWTENRGMGNWLKLHGVIEREDPVRRIPSGFVEIPVYRLTAEAREMFRSEAAKQGAA